MNALYKIFPAILFLLSGCSSSSNNVDETSLLQGNVWTLVSYSFLTEPEKKVLEGSLYTLNFTSQTELESRLDCNTFHSTYSSGPSSLLIDEIMPTEIACLQSGVAEYQSQHEFVVNALSAVVSYEISGSELIINSSDSSRLTYSAVEPSVKVETVDFIPLRIAHAGGGLGQETYTNSYEALNYNYQQGFKYFELDFVFTKDNEIVCLHDWGENFNRTFGFYVEDRLSFDEFNSLVEENTKFTNCTLDGLAAWMDENPQAYIVTDVKENNIDALKSIYEILPNAYRRVIPQVYQPENFKVIKDIGFDTAIWTLYRFSGDNNAVLDWTDSFSGPVAITMPRNRAESTLPKRLEEREIPTYVHTINSQDEANRFTEIFGIKEIYTDFLQPED